MDNQLKYNLIEKLVLTEDESILEQVNELLKGTELTYWDELNPRLKESIDKGLKQSLSGCIQRSNRPDHLLE